MVKVRRAYKGHNNQSLIVLIISFRGSVIGLISTILNLKKINKRVELRGQVRPEKINDFYI